VPKPILSRLLADLADSVPYRQNTRLPVVIPITISGKDEGGLPFEEGTQTIDIGRRGIRTLTLQRLPSNAQVRISDGALGKDRPARVVWQARTDSGDGRAETGVEFLEPLMPKGMRTLETLPDDWLNGTLQLTPSQKLEFFWARMRTYPVSPELKAMVESAKSLSVNELDGLTSAQQDLEDIERSGQASHEGLIRSNHEEKPETEIAAKPDLPQTQVDGKPVASAPSQAPALTARSSSQLPKVRARSAAKSHSHQEREQFLVEDLTRLAKILTDQADTISKGVDKAMDSVREVSEEAVANLRGAQQEIESHLEKVNTEYENRLAELGKSSAEEFRKKAETSFSNLREEFQQLEARARELAIEANQRNAQELATKPKDGPADGEASLADFRGQLERSLNEFRAMMAQEVEDQLRRGAANMREISAVQQKELHVKASALQQGNEDYASLAFVPRERGGAVPKKPLGISLMVAVFMAVATLVCGFAFFSTRPTLRLQAEPPAEFRDTTMSKRQQHVEEELSRAYWTCAVNVIQKTYRFGTALPAQAPPDFSIQPQDAAKVRSKAYLEASRQRYWRKLQQVWNNPRVWVQTYQWNTDWLSSPLKTLGLKLRG
jgi:hypothetical protein